MDFKKWLGEELSENGHWSSFQVGGYWVHILPHQDISDRFILNEARHRGTPLGGPYSAQLHPAHGGQGEQHLHVYARGNQIFALNVNGTAHDASHGVPIPNKVADAIRKRFPWVKIPPNNLIEGADQSASIAAIASLLQD